MMFYDNVWLLSFAYRYTWEYGKTATVKTLVTRGVVAAKMLRWFRISVASSKISAACFLRVTGIFSKPFLNNRHNGQWGEACLTFGVSFNTQTHLLLTKVIMLLHYVGLARRKNIYTFDKNSLSELIFGILALSLLKCRDFIDFPWQKWWPAAIAEVQKSPHPHSRVGGWTIFSFFVKKRTLVTEGLPFFGNKWDKLK